MYGEQHEQHCFINMPFQQIILGFTFIVKVQLISSVFACMHISIFVEFNPSGNVCIYLRLNEFHRLRKRMRSLFFHHVRLLSFVIKT